MASTLPDVTISDRAAQRILEITVDEPICKMLRISVSGGGCSGFQYIFDLASAPESDDVVIEHKGAKIVIDSVSLPLLTGSHVDFTDELLGSKFQIKNPNSTMSCGCGSSFSL
ncbi:MAG: Iron-sulfur cluster insertion protein ErpA [Hyphomicrobiaceae bacterium hypho_1]